MSQWVQQSLTPHPSRTSGDPAFVSDDSFENASIPGTFIHCAVGSFSSWMEQFTGEIMNLIGQFIPWKQQDMTL